MYVCEVWGTTDDDHLGLYVGVCWCMLVWCGVGGWLGGGSGFYFWEYDTQLTEKGAKSTLERLMHACMPHASLQSMMQWEKGVCARDNN